MAINKSKTTPDETTPPSESELHSRFVAMIDEREKLLYKIAAKYCTHLDDQEELVQKTICALWVSFPSFRGGSSETTWIHAVADNTGKMYMRSPNNKILVTDDFPEEVHPFTIDDEKATDMQMSIQHLKEADRRLLELVMQGYRFREISEHLGVSIDAIYKRAQRLRDLLKKLNS